MYVIWKKQAKKILTMGASHVLLKGGHLDEEDIITIIRLEKIIVKQKSMKN